MFLMRLPGNITDTTAPYLSGVPDPLLAGSNSGVLSLFDLESPLSWAKQAAPASGDTITDLAGKANLSTIITGTAPTFSGGGFDFTPCTSEPVVISAPAAAAANLHAAANDYFMVAFYAYLPSRAAWNVSANLVPWFTLSDSASGYTNDPDLVSIGMDAGTGGTTPKGISTLRQTAVGSAAALNLNDAAMTNHYGKVGQVAYWRNASGIGLRVRTSAGTAKVTAAAGAENTADYSTKTCKWGMPVPFASTPHTHKIYRGWVENLITSGRDPETVLDADYSRVISLYS